MAYLSTNLISNSQENKIKTNYQPIFPLKYDTIHGPYKPITSELSSIQQNFKNLLLTNPGEWPFNPEIGIGLRNYLFENHGSEKFSELKPKVAEQLAKFLPEIRLIDLFIVSTDDEVDTGNLRLSFRYAIFGTSFFEMIAEMYPSKFASQLKGDISFRINSGFADTDLFLGSKVSLTTGVRNS
tara:strand:- start:45984 stop:46532 length:549 start_codon:yes stop_codon:yes gene_type:complete